MEKTDKKNEIRKKKSFWKKIRFYFWVVIVLSLWIMNHHCATHGIPQWLQSPITEKLKKNGLHVSAQEATFSFTEGLLLKNFEFYQENSGIRLKAPQVNISYSPGKIFLGVFLPVHFIIRDGTADLPMLPEYGEEGKMDLVQIHQFNAELIGVPGLVEVQNASAKIGRNTLRMKGSINNLLHIMIEEIFSEYWEEDKSGKKWKKREYPYGIMQIFPLEVRKKFILTCRNYERLMLPENPECDITFYLDLNDFKQCTVNATILMPEFQYEGITVRRIREEISLKDGIVSLNEAAIDIGDRSALTVTGIYDDNGSVFKGKIKGNCNISELLKLTGNSLPPELEKYIVFRNDTVLFEGNLDHFSVSGNQFDTTLKLTLPEIVVDGVVMKNVDLRVHGLDGKLQGQIIHAELENGGFLSGDFSIDPENGITCSLQGKSLLSGLQNAMPREVQSFIQKKISFSGKEEPISFSTQFGIKNLKRKQFDGTFRIKYPHIRINGEEIREIEADLEFSPEKLKITRFSAKTMDGSKFAGSVEFDFLRKHINAKTVASGIPGRLAKTFDTIWQTDALSNLAKDISSKDPNGIAESDVTLFANYGENPFYHIAGNAVMKNPTYCGIPFRYGAARFLTDSSGKVIVPDLILKADYGTMQLESIYCADPANPEGGQMHFNLKSTLKGNDLLTIFCQNFDPILVDFPFPMDVHATGVIDYSDESKISVKATVKNGDCTFSGARVGDIDASLTFENGEIHFQNAKVVLAQGICYSDFRYHFKEQQGSFRQRLEGADLTEILKEFHITKFVPVGTGSGKVSFVSAGTFHVNEQKKLMINGAGDLKVEGNDLWNIPLFESFRKMVSDAWPMIGKSIGITEVSCKLVYDGDRAVIKDFKSNGTFMSIDTAGEFFWENGEYDFTIRAELLKEALPFQIGATILKPISWILSKNYKGKYIPPEDQK
ncbi:MAG: hypothetical protein IJW05_02865 [Lentisphaeria bacterium]|nr:hypothetical protein [Lentisphaeria bacterium]